MPRKWDGRAQMFVKLAGQSHGVCANALMRHDDAMRTIRKIHLDFARLSFPATMMSTHAFGSLRSVWARPPACQSVRPVEPGNSEPGPG